MLMTDKDREFLSLLEKETLRAEYRRKCDKPAELNDEEMQVVLSIKDSETLEKACGILRPLYQKYKGSIGKRVMPELIIRGIYFIIFREMSRLLLEDKNQCEKERKWISDEEEGKLRKRLLPDCTNKVYKLLGEKSSKVQERLGIQPIKDFTMLHYEPVGFHTGVSKKDKWFRTLFLNVVYHADYAMFIDLTGDDTILGDIYYGDREVVCCSDSVVANFYYALQLRYSEFQKEAKKIVDSMLGNMDENIVEYRSNLRREKQDIDRLTETEKQEFNKWMSTESDYPVIPTYPFAKNDIDIKLAVQYMVVVLDKNTKRSVAQLQDDIESIFQNQIQWLRQRLKDTIISWCSVKEMLSKIHNGNVRFLHMEKDNENKYGKEKPPKWVVQIVKKPDFRNPKVRHYTYYEELANTIKREKEKLRTELERELKEQDYEEKFINTEIEKKLKLYEKNKEKRVKKGFLFFDYTVSQNDEDTEAFFKFVKNNDCSWAFVCDRTESYWLERFKEVKKYRIGINQENPYSHYVRICAYRDVVIITNVRVEGIMVERIKGMLGAFDVSDDKLINSLIINEIFSDVK